MIEAVRDAVGGELDSWSTRTRGGGCPEISRRAGSGAPRPSSRTSSSGSTSSGSRSLCRLTTSRDTRSSAQHRYGSRPARWCDASAEARDLVEPRRSARRPARRRPGRWRRGPSGASPSSPPPRSVVEPAHVVERLRAPREPARGARVLDLSVSRGAVRPAGVDGRTTRLAPARRPSRSRTTGRSGRPPGPGLGVVPDFDALERYRIG